MKPGPLFTFVGLLALAVLMLAPISGGEFAERYPLLFEALENAAHPLIFMAVARYGLAYFQAAGKSRPYLLAFLVAFALGALTESAQLLTSRDGSLVDLWNDCLGAAIALQLHARRNPALHLTPDRRRILGPGAVLCMALAFMPLAWACAAYLQRNARVPVLWRHQSPLDSFFLEPTRPDYPGVEFKEPWPDWRGYRDLVIDIGNPESQPLKVTVRVDDRKHRYVLTDRYNGTFLLPPDSRQILRIPIESIHVAPASRLMDLADIRRIVIFQTDAKHPRKFAVHEIRLAP